MDAARNLREQRNINVLKLKNQDIKTQYASGKVRIDVPGTEQEMTSNTILAIPASLISKYGVTPAKSIKIDNYTQAGPEGKKVSSTVVGLQRNMVDLDSALNYTLETDGGKMAPANKKSDARKKRSITAPAVEGEDSDFGVAVSKPVTKGHKVTSDREAVELAKALLGR